MRALALILVLVAPALAGCLDDISPKSSGESIDPSLAWSVTDTQGQAWTNASIEGKPSLLFFMATWCPTCKGKTGALTSLHNEFGNDVQFVSISFDPSESDQDLDGWKAKYNQPWPHGVDATGAASNHYKVTVQSWIVVLDAQGRTVLNAYNPSESTMRDAIERAIAPPAA